MLQLILPVSIFLCVLLSLCAFFIVIKTAYFKKDIKENPAFCDLLDYAFLADDDIIVLKNGALLSICEITPCHLMNADESLLNESAHFMSLMCSKLDGLCAIHFDVIRDRDNSYLPFYSNKKSAASLCDSMRAAGFKDNAAFKNRFFISFTRKVPKLASASVKKRSDKKSDTLADEIASFKNFLTSAVNALEHMCTVKTLSFTGKDNEATHEALNFIFKSIYDKDAHLKAGPGDFLDLLLSPYEVKNDDSLIIDNVHTALVAVEGLPHESFFGILKSTLALPFAMRFNLRFIAFDNVISALYLEKYRRMWSQRAKSFFSQLTGSEDTRKNRYALDNMEEIDESKALLDKGEINFGSMSLNLVIRDTNEDELLKKCQMTLKTLEEAGFNGRIEGVNRFDAFLGTLPGHLFENLRRPIVSSDVLCDLMPVINEYTGESISPNPLKGMRSPLSQERTVNGSAFYLNLHEKDLANTLVIGPPGSGKSVLLGHLVLNLMRYKDMSVFIFEKGYSFYALTQALEGTHVNLKAMQEQLCPLYYLENADDIAAARDYIEYLMRTSGLDFKNEYRQDLDTALKLTAALPHNERTLSSFSSFLNKRELLEAMQGYLSTDRCTSVLDGRYNLNLSSSVTTVELDGVFDSSSLPPSVLLRHLFNLIERLRRNDDRPKAIVIDEAWLVLKDSLFAMQITSWLKTLRKDNIFVILATQSIDDLMSSPVAPTLLDCVKTRIFLPNRAISESEASLMAYKGMGLNDSDLKTIAGAKNKKHYYFVKGSKKALIELTLSPLELSLLSRTGESAKHDTDSKMAVFGKNFYEHL